jgi:hypothetical protein
MRRHWHTVWHTVGRNEDMSLLWRNRQAESARLPDDRQGKTRNQMIKFSGTTEDGRRVLGIGLSAGNWRKLMEGKPIVLFAQEVGEAAFEEVFIMAGETEQAMYDSLKDLGVLQGVPIHRFKETQ